MAAALRLLLIYTACESLVDMRAWGGHWDQLAFPYKRAPSFCHAVSVGDSWRTHRVAATDESYPPRNQSKRNFHPENMKLFAVDTRGDAP